MDLILINGDVETMDKKNPKAQAVAMEGGIIKKVGGNEEILKLKTDATKVIDVEGKMVLPGFHDAHMHVSVFGANLQECNLFGSASAAEVVDRTKAFIQEKNIEKGKWVIGKGWHQDYFDVKVMPTRYQLDEISTEHPICLMNAGLHSLSVNSKALELAGINKLTPQMEGGRFDTDEEGEPTGPFLENAMDLIYDLLPKNSYEDIKKLIIDACAYANRFGLTSVQSDDFILPGCHYDDVIRAYKELVAKKEIHVRVYEQCDIPDTLNQKEFFEKGYAAEQGDPYFKMGCYKIIADGNIGGRTAYMCEPYSDQASNCGAPAHSQETLNELVKNAHNNNMQVAIHCIGDKTAYMILEAFENALKENPREDHRHTLIHCQILNEDLLNKMKEMNVIASVQPIFLNYDLHVVEDRIGKRRTETSYNWRTMLDMGIPVAFGSDCPVEPMNVLPGIYSAVTRKDLNGFPDGGFYPKEKLSVYEAIYAFTMGSAYAAFQENVKGSITEGKYADIVVLSDNLYQIPEDSIKDVKPVFTIMDGEIVYQA